MTDHPLCQRAAYHNGSDLRVLELQYETPGPVPEPVWRVSFYRGQVWTGPPPGPADLAWSTVGQYQTYEVAWERYQIEAQSFQDNGWNRAGPSAWMNYITSDPAHGLRIRNSRRTYLPLNVHALYGLDSHTEPLDIICARTPLETVNHVALVVLTWRGPGLWQLRRHEALKSAVNKSGFGSMSTRVISEPTTEEDAHQQFTAAVTYMRSNFQYGERWQTWPNPPEWAARINYTATSWDEPPAMSQPILTSRMLQETPWDEPPASQHRDWHGLEDEARADLVAILAARGLGFAGEPPEPEPPLSHWDRLEI